MKEVVLANLKDPVLIAIREKYEAHYRENYGDDKKGLYLDADWRRIQYAASLIPRSAKRILEVGVGPGPMLNYLSMVGFDEVVGIDIRRYSRFLQIAPTLDYRMMSVDNIEFPDGYFDVVFCMEVLEHVPTDTMMRGIRELRRVTGGKLVMSVPFEEPLPLPSYHLQRFDMGRIHGLFPDGEITMLHRRKVRTGWPWALIVEEHDH